MRLLVGVPLWLSRQVAPKQRYTGLRGRVSADVAIVGGGITGAGIAQAFAEAGVKVVLLESKLVGRGSTAASTALVMHETDEGFVDLKRRYGDARAERLWTLSRSSVSDLVKTVRRLGIDCDLTERDAIYFTTRHERVADLLTEYKRRCDAGFPATWLDAAGLRAETGINGAGAIRTGGNARLDPYRACIGLIRAASTLSSPSVRAWVRRQRNDLRIPGCQAAARRLPEPGEPGKPGAVSVRPAPLKYSTGWSILRATH